jgi:hypothetical protein
MPENIFPTDWNAELLRTWNEHTKRSIRLSYIMQGIDPENLPTIQVKQPLPAEFLAARAEFAERWEAIIQEGEDKGFLDMGPDGDRWVDDETSKWVSVPNPDYNPDKPNPYILPAEARSVRIPKIGGTR